MTGFTIDREYGSMSGRCVSRVVDRYRSAPSRFAFACCVVSRSKTLLNDVTTMIERDLASS